MTLLQDLHCLARGRLGNGEDLVARHGDFFTSSTQHESQAGKGSREDPLAKLAHSVLFTASPKHGVQAEERDGQDLELEPSVEEDSGYQTSDSENENEKEREKFRDTVDKAHKAHERIQRHITPLSNSNGGDILDLSFPRGNKGLKRESEILSSGYERIKRRRSEDSIKNDAEDFEGFGDQEQEEEKAAPQLLGSGLERRERRLTGNAITKDGNDFGRLRDEEQKLKADRQRLFLETQKLDPERQNFDPETQERGSRYERINRQAVDSITRDAEDFKSLRVEEQKGEIVDEEQKEEAEPRTAAALANPLAVDSLREGEQREEITEDEQREYKPQTRAVEGLRKEQREEFIDKEQEEETLANILAVESLRLEEQKEDIIDEVQEDTQPQTAAVQANPLTTTPLHSGLMCCTNGFFRSTGGPLSTFESNCGCTTRNLVDWRTRVTWTNSNLFHQVRIREVTVLSPFRTSAIPWGLPGLGLRYCPPPQPVPQYQKPVSLPQKPKTQARAPQHALRLKKEQKEEEEENEDGERGYRCDQVGCGRTFCRNEELTRHLRIHSGQRPYACQRCGRRFVRRDHLTKHQRTHLPAHVKRSYTCPLPACTHRYTRSDALTRHMWTAHHIRARQPPRATTATTTTNHHHHHHHHHRSLNPKLET